MLWAGCTCCPSPSPFRCTIWGAPVALCVGHNVHVMGRQRQLGVDGSPAALCAGGWAALVFANMEPCLDLLASRGDPGQQQTATRLPLRRHRTQRHISISLLLHCAAGPCQPVQFGLGDRRHLRNCTGALPLANSMRCPVLFCGAGWQVGWPGLDWPRCSLLLGLAAALPLSSLGCCAAGTFTLSLSQHPRPPISLCSLRISGHLGRVCGALRRRQALHCAGALPSG